MSEQNNGGPAFPVDFDHQTFSPKNVDEAKRLMSGMSLLDYFAAKAMQMHGAELSEIAASQEEWDELVAERAYKTARAMLKARES